MNQSIHRSAMTRSSAPRSARLHRICALGAALAALAAAPGASAQEDAPAAHDGAGTELDGGISFASGVSVGFLRVQELGAVNRFSFIPSFVGLAYVPVAPRVFLRPGLRFGYAGLDQAQFSHGAAIEEHSWQATAELGVQYDAWLVPALSVGGGFNRRDIDFVGRGIWSLVQDGADVLVTYDWKIRTDKPLLRSLSFLLKPVFTANHQWAMAQGQRSLLLELARRHARSGIERALLPAPPGPTRWWPAPVLLLAAAGVMLGYAWLRRRKS